MISEWIVAGAVMLKGKAIIRIPPSTEVNLSLKDSSGTLVSPSEPWAKSSSYINI